MAAYAQTEAPLAPASPPAAQIPPPPEPQGKVIFSRSTGSPAAPKGPPAAEIAPPALAASVTDAMRMAPQFTAYDFTIHLQPANSALEVEAQLTLRNGGTAPLATLPLQVGSSLHFEHIRSGGQALRFAAHTIESDADHTGALTEAAVALPAPLAPGAALHLTVEYSGTISALSTRLDRIGTPAEPAAQSDWDRISGGFTGLRGFGDTVWYPVASVPAVLGQGDALFREIGRQKQWNSAAAVAMDLTVEYTGDAPNLTVIDGLALPVPAPVSLPTADFPGVEHITLSATPLGFAVPSIVVAARVNAASNDEIVVGASAPHATLAAAYASGANLLDPLFRDWFGAAPLVPLLLVDLPLEGAATAEDGEALLCSLHPAGPSDLAGELVHPLTHVYFRSNRAWLSEGVAGLMTVLWTERTEGWDKAIEQLGSGRGSLALAEPGSPAAGDGEPLNSAQDPVYYRTKATYVLWMLRSLVGAKPLAAALRAYDPLRDSTPAYFEDLVVRSLPAPAKPGPGDTDAEIDRTPTPEQVHAFFENWVNHDRGLPDLAITNVFSSKTGTNSDQWLVSVAVANTGYAEAEVPLTVRSATSSVTALVRVPARGTLSRRLLILGEPTQVDLNDGSVPEVEASVHKRVIE